VRITDHKAPHYAEFLSLPIRNTCLISVMITSESHSKFTSCKVPCYIWLSLSCDTGTLINTTKKPEEPSHIVTGLEAGQPWFNSWQVQETVLLRSICTSSGIHPPF